MSTLRKTILLIASALAILFGGGLAAIAAGQSPTDDAVVQALTPVQQQDLQFTREDERMARDLYTLFADKYGALPIFSQIARSEQRHFDAVGTLLVRYDLQDPSAGKAAGVYADATIQKLYDGWKAQGLQSSDEALKAATALETRDIADLRRLIAKDNPADVELVYTHLLAASEHHLAAFTAAVDGDLPATRCGGGMGWMRDGDGTPHGPGPMGNRGGMNR